MSALLNPKKEPFEVRFIVVGPEEAKVLLASSTVGNRKTADATVKRYADAMIRGDWVTTHQGLAVDDEGHLVDGQHRMQAVILSGTTQVFLVAYGVPRSAFDRMDLSRTRHAHQFLEAPHAMMKGTLARALLVIGRNGGVADARIKHGNIPPHDVLAFLEKHPSVMDYGNEWAATAKRVTADGRFAATVASGLLIGGWYAGTSGRAAYFGDAEALVSGEGVAEGSPMRALFRMAPWQNNEDPILRSIRVGMAYHRHESIKTLRSNMYREVKVW